MCIRDRVLAAQRPGAGHAQRDGYRIGRVPRDGRVMDALRRVWEAAQPAELPERRKRRGPPGQKLVYIALVPHVEHQPVATGIEDPVQRYGQLHRAQIGRQVSAGLRDGLNQGLPQLGAELRRLCFVQAQQILSAVQGIQNHGRHLPSSAAPCLQWTG